MALTEKQTAKLAKEAYEKHRHEIYAQTDRMFMWLLLGQWFFAIALALIVSPRSWYGAMSKVHLHVWTAIFLGGIINLFPAFLAWKFQGQALTRYMTTVAQVSNSALLIHLTGGRIETHFHVFGSLAIIAFYRDWKVLIPASIIVLFDHLLRGIYWPQSVYGVLYASPFRSLEHAAWVIFEDVFLVLASFRSKHEMFQIAEKQVRLEMINREVEQIVRERTAQLQNNESRFRAISEASPLGLFVTSPEGDCQYVNSAYERISGFNLPKALGRGWIQSVHPEDRERVVREWYSAVQQQPFYYESVYRFFSSGNIYWAKVKAVPLINENRLQGYLGVVDDITDQKLSEKKEQKLLSEAKDLAEVAQKKSHDLERFQQMAVGRELEMIRLKQEINDLLEQQRLPKKYQLGGK